MKVTASLQYWNKIKIYILLLKILFVVILINFIVDETLGEENTGFFIDDGDYMDMDLKEMDLKV